MKNPNENAEHENIEIYDERRGYRRKRRIRNQVIAYFMAVVLLAGIVVGANFGIQTLFGFIKDHQTANVNATEPNNPVESEPTENEAENASLSHEEEIPPLVEEAEPEISVLDMIVENCIAELTIEEKIAGLFIITPDSLTGTDGAIRAGDVTRNKLLEYPVGGLVYFGSNIQSAGQITEMLENTRNMSKYPLFLAIDEEGGSVARLANKNLAGNVGPMASIGQTLDPENAKTAGTTIGTYLSDFGFNVNFAPVADVGMGTEDHPLGDRTFSTDPAVAADMVRAFVYGMKESGVHSTLKHFPGLGYAEIDTHEGMAIVERTLDEMRVSEFLPFIAGIDAGAELIMVSHISAPNATGDNTPASLSKKMITEILRGELGYDGVVITDALNMGAITEYYTAAEASVKALQAGADIILMPESFAEAYIGVMEALESGKITEERINESLRRIYRVKYATQVE